MMMYISEETLESNSPNKIKNWNVKLVNLMLWVKETRFLDQHELCKCNCKLNENVCNSRQQWNCNECWCQWKELDDQGSCERNYIWNPEL